MEIGCVHAEQNAIYNAARRGVSLVGSWFIINGEPCKVCAKAIIQVGAEKVICIEGGYSCKEGIVLLQNSGVGVYYSDDLESLLMEKTPQRISRRPVDPQPSPFGGVQKPDHL
jgi:deoxycytidylate deaminase